MTMRADRRTVLSLLVLAAICAMAVIFFQWGAH
jgi:cell division protein FtsL